MVGHSQGGLLARAVVQSWPLHPVRSLITLAAPHAGQFGLPSTLHLPSGLNRLARLSAYRLLYSDTVQRLLSVANYWLDPCHYRSFLTHSRLLADINNLRSERTSFPRSERSCPLLQERSCRVRAAMLRLARAVLVAGPDDGTIVPWQSGHFGFFSLGPRWRRVRALRGRPTYRRDLIGLRTLDRRGDLLLHTFPGVSHQQWPRNADVFRTAIAPYLD